MADPANTLGGKPLQDPILVRDYCLDHLLPVDSWWGRANVFRLPVGEEWGTGTVLLRRQHLDELDKNTDHTMVLRDHSQKDPVTLKKLTVVRATCLTPGEDGDPAAVYLVELVDRRYHLARVPISKAYNLVKPDGASYHSTTLNGGSPWTWAGILQNIWAAIPQLSPAPAPALPFTPHGTPEGMDFYGGLAWRAYNHVLTRIACAIEYDVENDAWSIVRLGATEAAADKKFKELTPDRVWDTYPVDPDRGGRSEKVRVLFRRFPAPPDGTDPYYAVDITIPAKPGVVVGSFLVLRDDLTAVGATGTPTNSATLTARAQERADDWVRKHEGHDRRLLRVYRGWRNDGRTLAGATVPIIGWEDRGGGMKTEAAAGPDGRLEGWDPGELPHNAAAAGAFIAHVRPTVKTSDGPPRRYTVRVQSSMWADASPVVEYTNVIEARDRPVRMETGPHPVSNRPVPLFQLSNGTYYFAIDQEADYVAADAKYYPGEVNIAQSQTWTGQKKVAPLLPTITNVAFEAHLNPTGAAGNCTAAIGANTVQNHSYWQMTAPGAVNAHGAAKSGEYQAIHAVSTGVGAPEVYVNGQFGAFRLLGTGQNYWGQSTYGAGMGVPKPGSGSNLSGFPLLGQCGVETAYCFQLGAGIPGSPLTGTTISGLNIQYGGLLWASFYANEAINCTGNFLLAGIDENGAEKGGTTKYGATRGGFDGPSVAYWGQDATAKIGDTSLQFVAGLYVGGGVGPGFGADGGGGKLLNGEAVSYVRVVEPNRSATASSSTTALATIARTANPAASFTLSVNPVRGIPIATSKGQFSKHGDIDPP